MEVFDEASFMWFAGTSEEVVSSVSTSFERVLRRELLEIFWHQHARMLGRGGGLVDPTVRFGFGIRIRCSVLFDASASWT